MVTDFSKAEKDSGVKLCVVIQLLSMMSSSHFGELGLAGSHGGSITSGIYAVTNWMQAAAPGKTRWGFGIGFHGSVGQSELGAAAVGFASCKPADALVLFLIHLTYFLLFYQNSHSPTPFPGRRS